MVNPDALQLLRDAEADWPGRAEEWARSEEWLGLLFERSATAMCVVSPKGEFMLVNPALCRMLDRPASELIGMRWQEVTHPDDVQADLDNVERAFATDTGGFRMLKRFIRADGGIVWGDLATSYICDDAGTIRNWVSQIIDVSERVAVQEELAWQATHDVLTGLPNRAAIFAHLDRRTEGPATSAQAVLFIDVDNFKTVNDAFGHATGDRIIVEVSRVLQSELPPDGLVGRMGGDEFLVILNSCPDTAAAVEVGQRMLARVRDMSPLTTGEHVNRISLSIGITLRRDGDSPDEVVAQADAAMYEAKQTGRDRVVARLI